MAELTAVLDARIAPLVRAFAEATAATRAMKAELDSLEARTATLELSHAKFASTLRGGARDLDNWRSVLRQGVSDARDARLETDNLSTIFRKAGNDAREAERGTAAFNRELERLKRNNAGGGASGGPLAGILPGGARAGPGAIGALAATAGPAIAPLIPSIGALATVPALLGTIGAEALVAREAFKGMGAAIGGSKKAYDGLNESQQSFVDTIRNGVYPLLNGLKQIVTTNTFAPITAAIREVVANKEALANIGGIARELAQGVGQLAASWIKFLGSAQVTREIGQFFAAWIPIVQEFMPIIQSLFQSFLQFETAIAPLGQFLADAFAKGAKAITDWVSNGKNATDFVTSVEQSLRLLWATVETLANVFRSLYDVLAPIGRVILPDILHGLNFVADGLRSNAKLIGTDYVGAWKAVVDIIKVLAPLIGPMFRAWFGAIGLVVKQVDAVASHLKFLDPVVQFLSGVFDRFGKYIFLALSGPTALLVVAWQKWGKDIKAIFTDVGNGFVWMLNNLILKPWETTINAIISALNVLPFVNIGKVNYQIPTIGGPGNTAAFSGAPSAGGVGLHSGPGGSALAAAAGAAVSAGLGQTGATRAQIKSSPGPGLGYSGAFGGTYRQQGRTDQGVDFSGAGAITAIGNGIVMRCERGNSGWPNGDPKGAFLSIYLTEGSRQGWTYFIAEYFTIAPGLTSGTRVRAGQVVGHEYGGIEMGWVSSPSQGSRMSGNALTSQLGQQGKGGDPGNVSYQGQQGSQQGQDFASFLSTGGGFSPLAIPQIGGAPAFTGGPRARKPRKPSLLDLVLPPDMAAELEAAQRHLAEAQAGAGAPGTPGRTVMGPYGSYVQPGKPSGLQKEIEAERSYIAELKKVQEHLDSEHATGDKLKTLERERLAIARDLTKAHKDLTRELLDQQHAQITSRDMTLLRGSGVGAAAPATGSISLRREYQAIQRDIQTYSLQINSQVQRQLAVFNQILQQKYIDPHVRDIIRERMDAIKQTITDRIAAMKQALSDAGSAFDSFASRVLAAFDAINSKYQSPASKQLAEMQKEDRDRQLQANLAAAKASGDAQQIADAERAIQEAALEDQAKQQQDAHDAETKAQKDALEKQLANLRSMLQKHKITWKEYKQDVDALLKSYGITPDALQAATDWQTAQGLFVESMSELRNAMKELGAPQGAIYHLISSLDHLASQINAGRLVGDPPPSGGTPHAASGGIFASVPGGVYRALEGGHAEGIVSLDPSKRMRSTEIWAKIGQRLGVPGFQDGGIGNDPLQGPSLGSNTNVEGGGGGDGGGKRNPHTGTLDTPAMRAAAMWINDYGSDKYGALVAASLTGSLGPRSQAQAALRHTFVDGTELSRGSWRAPMLDPKMLALLTARYPGIVFEGGTPGQQISAAQAVSRIAGGLGSVAELIQSSMGLTGSQSKVERMTSHAIHFGSGYLTEARTPVSHYGHSDPGYYGRMGLPPGGEQYPGQYGGSSQYPSQPLPPYYPAARGALVRARPGGTLILAGEAGEDEMVMPMSRAGGRMVVEIHNHHYLDGQQITDVVTTRQISNGRYGRPGFSPPTI